jgi:hypothetical protein
MKTQTWLAGIVMNVAGLSGHLLAAAAIANKYTTSWIAYRDHVGGFLLIMLVLALIVAPLGRKFWRGRPDRTVLIIGAIQLAFGIFVYFMRFRIVGH